LLLACVAICAASPIAHSAETEITPAPKLSEIKPDLAARPKEQSPEPKPPASKTPTKKPTEKPAPGHAFDGAASAVETIRPVGTHTAALATLLENLKKGELTPAAAFQSGQMTGAQALELLADTTIGTLQYRPLVHELAAIVATKAPHLIADVEKVAPQAKVRLAPYFLETRDPRAVPFYESILAALPQPPSEQGARPVFMLSNYYAAIGDLKKAAETRLRMKDYTTSPQFLANSEVEAARFYRQLGEEEKAQKLYEGASRHGYGWATGLMLIDQGRALMVQGKYEAARQLFSTPVKGQYAEDIEPVKQMLLGDAYYQSGNLEQARRNLQAAVTAYNTDPTKLPGEGLENIFAAAQERLQIAERLIKEPIQVEPSELQIATSDKSLIRRLRVRTFRDVPLELTSSHKSVTARILALDSWGEKLKNTGDRESEKVVVIEIAREALQSGLKATLVIGSPKLEYQAQVKIELKKP
jgi:tetratricopeptide (TPR) repeat protein